MARSLRNISYQINQITNIYLGLARSRAYSTSQICLKKVTGHTESKIVWKSHNSINNNVCCIRESSSSSEQNIEGQDSSKQVADQESTFSMEDVEEILREQSNKDMPLSGLPNPYEPPAKRCIICQHNVHVDYKNVRLLSQFVSPHTGQIYGRHITGLCVFMQRYIAKCIKRSRISGFMPYVLKDPHYITDPKLFDPFKRTY